MAYTPGELLVRDGVITASAHRRALALRSAEGGSFGEALVRLGVIDEESLAMFYHRRLVLPLVGASRFSMIDPRVLRLVPKEVAAEFRVFPVNVDGDGSLLVAMADPSDNHAVEELGFFVDRFVMRGVAAESMIRRAIEEHYQVKFPRAGADAAKAPARDAPSAPAAQVDKPQGPLFPANVRIPAYDPLGVGETSVDGPVVLLTKKKRNDETPLPPPAPPPISDSSVSIDVPIDTLLDEPPLLLTQARRRERTSTLPGLAPAPSVRPPIAALRAAADRDEVARILLDYAAQIVGRATLFVVRKGVLAGFDARGGGLDRSAVEVLQFPLASPSVFRDVTSALLPFRGSLPESPQNRTISRAMGVLTTAEVLVWPILIRDRAVAVLFGDHITTLLPEADLQATVHEAGLAYARIIVQARANA